MFRKRTRGWKIIASIAHLYGLGKGCKQNEVGLSLLNISPQGQSRAKLREVWEKRYSGTFLTA
jgi:hypothetical protein